MKPEDQMFIDALQQKVFVVVELLYDASKVNIIDAVNAVRHIENPKLKVVSERLTWTDACQKINWNPCNYLYIARHSDIKTPLAR